MLPSPESLQMHLAESEILAGSGMAFAAGLDQVALVDRRIRIAGWQDLVIAMATRAVRRVGRAALDGQAMITVEERLHAVRRQAELGVDALGLVAAAADRAHLERGAFAGQRADAVLRMAVGADRRFLDALGGRLAMHALRHFLRLGFVALHRRFPPGGCGAAERPAAAGKAPRGCRGSPCSSRRHRFPP